MSESAPNFQLLDGGASVRGVPGASDFHQINNVVPRDQKLVSFEPHHSARDAMVALREREYSQAPVVANDLVVGVFSFRSFAKEVGELALPEWNQRKCAPGDLEVRDCLEEFQFARVTDELSSVFEALDRDNGVLVGAPDRLIGILTPMDVLRYFHHIASPFVLMSEIEMALRRLIRGVLTEEEIAVAARECLADAYRGREGPVTLEAMTFGDYESLIGFGKTWPQLRAVFGANRIHTKTRLAEIGRIRNDLFHFRQGVESKMRHQLSLHRNWCLAQIRIAEARARLERRR